MISLTPPESDCDRAYAAWQAADRRLRSYPRMSYRQLLRLAKRGTLKSTIAGWRKAKGITP